MAVGLAGDAAAASNVDRCVTLTMDPFEVAAGAEVFMCQQFANPFGRDVDLIWIDGAASPTSIFYVFSMDPAAQQTESTSLSNCVGQGLEFHPTPFVAQQPHWTVSYPDPTMGYPLPAANALMLDAHYLNVRTSPVKGQATVTLCDAKPGVVTTHVGTLFLYNRSFSLPPTPMSNPVTVTDTFTPSAGQLPSRYFIHSAWGFMTSTGLDMQATTGDGGFYDQTGASSPSVHLVEPALPMTGTQPISWSCKFYNDTSQTLSWGDSVISNAWCLFMAGYHPADPSNPDVNYIQ